MMIKLKGLMNHNFYSTSSKNWPEILGRRGPLLPAHHIAYKYIEEGKPIKAVDVNRVLAFADIKITQSRLDKILGIPTLELSNLDCNTIKSDYFLQNIGTVRSKIQVPGVYIWTHLSTGHKYVGSSSALARRLIGYFNGTHKDTGKLIPLIKSEGVGAFKLQVIPLIESYTVNEELSLEQYFLLQCLPSPKGMGGDLCGAKVPEFNLNTLKVVNNFSGVRAKPLYMYTKDFSELIYSSCIQEDFIFNLRIHHSNISRSLKTGELYLGKYVFTDRPITGVKEMKMSVTEINTMLDKDRAELQVFQGRKVILTAGDKKEFNSISDAITYLNTIAPSNKTTLYRYIESGKPYNGYICSWKDKETSLGLWPFVDKSVCVSITHTPTGVTNVFPSFRKAALSFAPKIITTGQTLKVFAENGKLFKDEYKIKLIE